MDNVNANPLNYRVLAVDENMMTLNLVMNMLKKSGLEQVETSTNGQDAWDKISAAKEKGNSYDILILDWNMPVMNGYDVLRRCREDQGLDRTAIIMLSAENQKRNILEAMKAGATSYMVKPVDAKEFNEKLQQVFLWMNKNKKAS
jgi:two-component system chemotaxis response regulator CheY